MLQHTNQKLWPYVLPDTKHRPEQMSVKGMVETFERLGTIDPVMKYLRFW